jgi:hypothetical protein
MMNWKTLEISGCSLIEILFEHSSGWAEENHEKRIITGNLNAILQLQDLVPHKPRTKIYTQANKQPKFKV